MYKQIRLSFLFQNDLQVGGKTMGITDDQNIQCLSLLLGGGFFCSFFTFILPLQVDFQFFFQFLAHPPECLSAMADPVFLFRRNLGTCLSIFR